MPRFIKEYLFWIAAGVVALALWGVHIIFLAPRQRTVQGTVREIKSAEKEIDDMLAKEDIPNEKWVAGLEEPIRLAKILKAQVDGFMTERSHYNVLNHWLGREPEWGEAFLAGTSTHVQRIEYRQQYSDVVASVFNELVLPLLPPAKQIPVGVDSRRGSVLFIKTVSWGEAEPSNSAIVTANTDLIITAAFCDMLLSAREEIPGLFLYINSMQLAYAPPLRVMGEGYDSRRRGPREPARRPGDLSGEEGLDRVLARRAVAEDEPGWMEPSDPETGKYVFSFSISTVMDWRNINVLIGKIVESPALEPRVDDVDWVKSKVRLEDVEAPLVDVTMQGRLFVDWPEGVSKKPVRR